MNRFLVLLHKLIIGYSNIEIKFYKLNNRYWRKPLFVNEDYILLDGIQHHPEHLIQAARISKAIEEVEKSQILCLLHTNIPRINSYRYLYKSFHINKFISIFPKIMHPFILINSYLSTRKFLSDVKFENVENLLKTKISDLYVGDLLIDTLYKNKIILKNEIINKNKFNDIIKNMFYFYYYYNFIFYKYKIKHVILSHRAYVLYGLLARIANKNGSIVYLYNQTRVRKYLPKDNIMIYEGKPVPEHIEYIMCNIKEYKKIIDDYLIRKFNGEINEIDVELNRKTRIYTREEIIAQYNFDNKLPIVIVFLHVIADANHLNEHYLFNSHYDWLVKTVEIIRQNKKCNWLIKAHPSEIYYDEVGLAKRIVNDIITPSDNIKFANDDFKNSSAIGVAKAIVTVHGTAGLEFSCYGIPSILAGAAHFSGFGFTLEPVSITNYKTMLSKVDDLSALTQRQIDTAKAVYFAYEFLNNVPSKVYPDFFPNAIATYKERKNEEIKFLKNINEKLAKNDPKEDLFFYALIKLVEDKNARQIINPLYWK